MRANSKANAVTLAVLTAALAAMPQPLAGASWAPRSAVSPVADEVGPGDSSTTAPTVPSSVPPRSALPAPSLRCEDVRGDAPGKTLRRSGVLVLLRSNGRTWRLNLKPSEVRQGYATWSKPHYAMM
ncbi:hypothetical protein EDF56_103241 [Novosphingobium sp. PhB165]|uniref:hypothetical protein n=1 Tax=Novosphingobium sp. PhB165 TaxID=2485105 RepID=UPI001048A14D|nr:hypothetical protein [Novosphingobium sp. PhB165]TCM19598.1 hypothetical protein EDF56_103241 [Novosphingobium sp. PhB165]